MTHLKNNLAILKARLQKRPYTTVRMATFSHGPTQAVKK